MTRKISGHDGDLVVNGDVELSGEVTGQLVVEPGGSAVIRGSVVGSTLSVDGESEAAGDSPDLGNDIPPEPDSRHDHDSHDDLDAVISEIP
jgi:hypothetical protein